MEADAEYLRKRYSGMETERLIELRRSGTLTDTALVVLDAVLASRGITEEMRSELADKHEEGIPHPTEKSGGQSAGDWFTKKRGFGLSLSGLLSILILGTVYNHYFAQPMKTNRSYLREVIENGYIENAAAVSVDTMKKADTGRSIGDAEWENIKRELSECMLREANRYLVSEDPFLDERANKETPRILAERFLKTCGALE